MGSAPIVLVAGGKDERAVAHLAQPGFRNHTSQRGKRTLCSAA